MRDAIVSVWLVLKKLESSRCEPYAAVNPYKRVELESMSVSHVIMALVLEVPTLILENCGDPGSAGVLKFWSGEHETVTPHCALALEASNRPNARIHTPINGEKRISKH